MGMLSTLVGSRLPAKYQKYFDLPARQASTRIPGTTITALGSACHRWFSEHDAVNAVYRLDSGLDALGIRLGLISCAQQSIDIQSYLIRDDLSGNLVALALIEAADRGVRVRLLMDDALTEPIDTGLMALNDHANIEVRVFNPFPRRRSRLISFIANFNILNRRMHNKSFTVDGHVTIVGGRNLADEYYQMGAAYEFVDEDLLAIGEVVDKVSDGFDTYWNTPEAIPVSVFDPLVKRHSIDETVAEGHRFLDAHKDSEFLQRLDDRLTNELLAGELDLLPADVDVVMDLPEKVRRIVKREPSETLQYLQQMVSAATQEVVVVSPYFVPQQQGVEFFASLVERGVRVIIVTNSLASTNHNSVHAVYARYRKPLIEKGVELYELAAGVLYGGSTDSRSMSTKLTLHSKVAVVDRRRSFVGSFNLDPRSLYVNTEMGMVVDSTVLGQDIAHSIIELLPKTAYRLRLDEAGKLCWAAETPFGESVERREPGTSFWRRFSTALMSYLPIEGQM